MSDSMKKDKLVCRLCKWEGSKELLQVIQRPGYTVRGCPVCGCASFNEVSIYVMSPMHATGSQPGRARR